MWISEYCRLPEKHVQWAVGPRRCSNSLATSGLHSVGLPKSFFPAETNALEPPDQCVDSSLQILHVPQRKGSPSPGPIPLRLQPELCRCLSSRLRLPSGLPRLVGHTHQAPRRCQAAECASRPFCPRSQRLLSGRARRRTVGRSIHLDPRVTSQSESLRLRRHQNPRNSVPNPVGSAHGECLGSARCSSQSQLRYRHGGGGVVFFESAETVQPGLSGSRLSSAFFGPFCPASVPRDRSQGEIPNINALCPSRYQKLLWWGCEAGRCTPGD